MNASLWLAQSSLLTSGTHGRPAGPRIQAGLPGPGAGALQLLRLRGPCTQQENRWLAAEDRQTVDPSSGATSEGSIQLVTLRSLNRISRFPKACIAQVGDTLEEFLVNATEDAKLRQVMMSLSEAVRTIAFKVCWALKRVD